ncbi:MAG: methyltransferase RsmF C-terminal domain-like protein [Lewinella sp.]|jgi:16S rRNA C967 or C1407 C5-methylase (RsmB/RsmF family)/NOL1/NOP2/fmu family ribosome biogenesis protein|uniref:methyltransferase RsmF C-terminal domain-like protein n=1 Tax=Lewinella sp. TaxID=2004506 RepID=UPI003D6B052D
MAQLPVAFQAQMKNILKEDYPVFAASLETDPPVSLHLHPLKKGAQFPTETVVPWHIKGRYLAERPSFTLDPLFHAGAYYVQEASSMLVAAAFRQCFPGDRPLRVLDLCAAPGGKSTLLTSLLPEGSWLLANEVIRSRYQILRYNLSKWGYANTFTSNHDVEDFKKLAGFFDLVLVDAPCSGEGLFRKDQAARQEWSPESVNLCAARQGRILKTAAELVAPGGVLLYSTCTYNQQENDENAAWLANESGLTYKDLDFPAQWGLEKRTHGYQAYPHRIRGEGFFLAALQKPEIEAQPKFKATPFRKLQTVDRKLEELAKPWIAPDANYRYFTSGKGSWRILADHLLQDAQILSQHLNRLEVGTILGDPKGKQLVPSPEWALQLDCRADLPHLEVDHDTALEFLRKATPPLSGLPKGWVLIRHQGLNLGWVKGLGNRYNNYYPKQWRIRMGKS